MTPARAALPAAGRGARRLVLAAALAPLAGCPAPEAVVDSASVVAQVPPPPIVYPVHVDPQGRRLTDREGHMVVVHGEAAWGLVAQLDTLDTERYLEDRRRKGFNAIYVRLIEHRYSDQSPAWNNHAGHPPFRSTLPDGSLDFTAPDEAYWEHVDHVLRIAQAKGLLVVAFPAYLGYYSDDSGWSEELAANGADRVRRYGAWLGSRYAAQPNLMWGMGGDRQPGAGTTDLTPLVNVLADGIRSRDSVHLMTAHSGRNRSAMDDYDQPWLDINSTYAAYVTVDGRPRTAVLVRADYHRRPVKPFLFLEGHYENEHGIGARESRTQAYWAMLGGAAGHFYGNWPIWAFGAAREFGDDRRLSWERALRLEGAQDMVHLGDLLRSRPFGLLLPDDEACVPMDRPTAADDPEYIACARASDGSTLLAYVPAPRTVSVDLAGFADTLATAWWFDPRTGAAERIGVYPTGGTRAFAPPGAGDWVLVVDALQRGFPPPGRPAP